MGHPLLTRFYDWFLWPGERLGMEAQRDRLVGGLHGNVIEIGVGTGLNLPHYPASVEVDAIDPNPHMLGRAQRRASEALCSVRFHEADAGNLPFRDDSFDHAVVSLALCTIPRPEEALAELARVVRTGGSIHFLEHVRSTSARRSRWQDRLAPVWSRVAGGCRLNQDTEAIIRSMGLDIDGIWHASSGGMIQGDGPRPLMGSLGSTNPRRRRSTMTTEVMDMQRAQRKPTDRRKVDRHRSEPKDVADRIEKNRDTQIEKMTTSQLKA